MTEIVKVVTLGASTGDRPIQVRNPMFNYEEGSPLFRSTVRYSTYIKYDEEEAEERRAGTLIKIQRSSAKDNGNKHSRQGVDNHAAVGRLAGMRDLVKVRITPACEYDLSGEAIL